MSAGTIEGTSEAEVTSANSNNLTRNGRSS
jgi:hypothetical protein